MALRAPAPEILVVLGYAAACGLVLALGFDHVSDDDYARVTIAQAFAHRLPVEGGRHVHRQGKTAAPPGLGRRIPRGDPVPGVFRRPGQRIAAQHDAANRIRRVATRVIDTSGAREATRAAVESSYQAALAAPARG